MKKIFFTICFFLFLFLASEAEANQRITPTDITPGTSNAWVDVDVSAYVDAGNTAGVILEMSNPTFNYYGEVRKNGSTDDGNDLEREMHSWFYIGVDSNDIFEAYVHSGTTLTLVGYINNNDGAFFTNSTTYNVSSLTVWEDIDISSATGADTAKIAFLILENSDTGTGNQEGIGMRENGSTDNNWTGIEEGSILGGVVSVDENEIFEGYLSNSSDIIASDVDFKLVGYMTDKVYTWTNVKDYSTGTTGSYQDVDLSSDIPDGYDGAFFHFESYTDYLGHVRSKDDSGWDSYNGVKEQTWLWTSIDSNRTAQQKIESTDLDLWLFGYTVGITNVDISTAEATNVASSSARLNGELIAMNSADNADTGFVYGIGSPSGATSTVETATSSIGTYYADVSGLTTLKEYQFRAYASSSLGVVYGETFSFYTADITTSTDETAEWNSGNFSTTTASNGTLTLDPQLGSIATTTDTFESGFGNWSNVSGDDFDWSRDSGGTPSSGTGPSSGAEGSTYYLYTEASSPNYPNKEAFLEYDVVDNSNLAFDFWYHAYGSDLGSIYLEKYNGSTWSTIWSDTDNGSSNTWFNVYVEDTGGDATKVRFRAPVDNSSWASDIAIDSVEVGESSLAYEEGSWVSPAWNVGSISDVDGSIISWATSTPGSSSVVFKTAVNTSSVTPPGSYTTVSNGGSIAGISNNDDLSGKYVWVEITLIPDGSNIPEVYDFWMGINEGGGGGEPVQRRRIIMP